MPICIFIYLCMYIYTYLYIYMYIHISIHIYVYTYIYTYIYVYIYLYIYTHTHDIHMYTYMHNIHIIYIYMLCTYIYIRIYIYMYMHKMHICVHWQEKVSLSARARSIFSPVFSPVLNLFKKDGKADPGVFCNVWNSSIRGVWNITFNQSGYVWCVYLCHMNLGCLPTKTWESLLCLKPTATPSVSIFECIASSKKIHPFSFSFWKFVFVFEIYIYLHMYIHTYKCTHMCIYTYRFVFTCCSKGILWVQYAQHICIYTCRCIYVDHYIYAYVLWQLVCVCGVCLQKGRPAQARERTT